MSKNGLLTLLVVGLMANCLAEPMEKPGVTYEKRPSGRVYGSDGSLTDPKPSAPNKVYDSDGKAYHNTQTIPNAANTLAKPLPRATSPVGRSTGVRPSVGSGIRR